VRVRRANATDIPRIMELERKSATAAHWTQEQYAEALARESEEQRAERLAWVAEEDLQAQPQVAKKAPEIVAFLIARRVDAEWELENVVVASRARRKGLGSLLIKTLAQHAVRLRGTSIFLEVRESNQAARALYEGVGFEESGVRKNYYANPAEDAILYRLNVG
jgi:[ribosomal protein S18]-alanine N-acetyltransferase